jgi:hypothetical protein
MFQPRFELVRDQRILRLDYRGLSCAELETAFLVAGRLIAREPPASLLILTFLESRFDSRTAEALKHYVIGNGPYVRASAVLARGFWRSVMTTLKLGVRSDLHFFDDERAALDWLVARGSRAPVPVEPVRR